MAFSESVERALAAGINLNLGRHLYRGELDPTLRADNLARWRLYEASRRRLSEADNLWVEARRIKHLHSLYGG